MALYGHESITSVWSKCLRDLNIHHKYESRNHYTNSTDKPDIVFDVDSGSSLELDIAPAHPSSSDTFPKSAEMDGQKTRGETEEQVQS